jgi:ABC-type lipoprotein release transport system permease subunit
MKNKLFLSIRYQFRKKSNIFNIFFIGFAMFLTILMSTYSLSAINYMNNDIYDSFYYKTIEVWKNETDMNNENISLDDIEGALWNINHVANVSSITSYRNLIHSDDLETSIFDGYVELFSANEETLPEIIVGENTLDSDEDYIICPINFYPNSNLEDLKFVSSSKKVNLKNLVGKYLTFDYKSNYESNKYNIKMKLVGLYQNSSNFLDENKCYVSQNTLKKIAIDQYSDDIDSETNKSNLDYQISFIVEVDNINNLKSVESKLTNLGYNYEPMASVSIEYFNNIRHKMNIIIIIIITILFVFIIIVLQKKFKEESYQYKIKTFLGYSKSDIRLIYIFSSIFNILISIIGSILISFILVFIMKILINNYPFLFNKWDIIINYFPVLIIAGVLLVATIISSIYNIFGDKYD